MMNYLLWPYLGAGFVVFLILATIWEVVWKGIALWKAARNEHKIWFIFILVLNTLGILPIIYIVFFSKKKSAVTKIISLPAKRKKKTRKR